MLSPGDDGLPDLKDSHLPLADRCQGSYIASKAMLSLQGFRRWTATING
jgi:hypothetical protein